MYYVIETSRSMLTLIIGDLHIPERVAGLPEKFKKLLAPNAGLVPSNNKIAKVICLGNITNSYETLQFLHTLSPSFHIVRGELDDVALLTQQVATLEKSAQPIPFHLTISHDNLRIGFTNGYQVVPKNDPLALSTLAREWDVDILVWGSTHKVEAYTLDGKFFINPGSATGAFSFDWPDKPEEEEDEEDEEEEKGEEEESGEAESQDKQKEELTDDTKTEAEVDEDLLAEVAELASSIPSFCLLDIQGSRCTLYIYTYIQGEVKVDKVTYSKD